MASALPTSGDAKFVPEPWALLGLLVVGVPAVLVLPSVAGHLPRAGRPEQATYAATCAGVVVLSAAYVATVARRLSLPRTWVWVTLGYSAGLAVVKFILSPAAFDRNRDTTLGRFVATGLVVVVVYLVGLAVLYAVARRGSATSLASRLSIATGLAAVAVLARIAAAAVFGDVSAYLRDLVGGPGLVLPAVVVLAALAVLESLDRAGPAVRAALGVGVALVLVDHALWVVYMERLFS